MGADEFFSVLWCHRTVGCNSHLHYVAVLKSANLSTTVDRWSLQVSRKF